METLKDTIEELILQHVNYKEVLSVICEYDDLASLKLILREQVQESNAFIYELEDCYKDILMETNSISKQEFKTINYWLNSSDFVSSIFSLNPKQRLVNANVKCLALYDDCITKLANNRAISSKWLSILQVQKSAVLNKIDVFTAEENITSF